MPFVPPDKIFCQKFYRIIFSADKAIHQNNLKKIQAGKRKQSAKLHSGWGNRNFFF